jgi:hypothetical protein
VFYLGSITAASGGYNNLQTGASGIGAFTIPTGVAELYLQPSASGLQFEMFQGVTGGTNTTAARGVFLDFANGGSINGPFHKIPKSSCVVGIYNAAGGFLSVRVYAAPNR